MSMVDAILTEIIVFVTIIKSVLFQSPSFNKMAMLLGPKEYVILIIAFTLVLASMSVLLGTKKRYLLPLIGLAFFIRMIGTDLNTGDERFTFGFEALNDGIDVGLVASGLIIGSCLFYLYRLLKFGRNDASIAPVFKNDRTKGIMCRLFFGLTFILFLYYVFALTILIIASKNISALEGLTLLVFFCFGVLVRFFRLALLPLHFMLIMGSFLEENFRRALLISRNDLTRLFEGTAMDFPFNLLFLAAVAVFIGAVFVRKQIVSGRLAF